MGRVEDHNDNLDAPQHIPCPLAIPMSPNPESTALLRACLVNPIRLSDTLLEEDVVNECPTMGCLTLSQARLKAAIKRLPKPWLLDNIAALMCAHLATHSACDEFGPQASRYPPDKSLGMDKRRPSDVVSKTTWMSIHYSPASKTALSLPKTLPAILSQALIPHPGFNGHKPTLFIEGEGRLKESVISKKCRVSVSHSLVRKTAHTLSLPELVTLPKAPFLLLREPQCTIGLKRHPSVANGHCSGTEGSSSPEPFAVHHSPTLGFMLERWLLWKPPGMMETK